MRPAGTATSTSPSERRDRDRGLPANSDAFGKARPCLAGSASPIAPKSPVVDDDQADHGLRLEERTAS